MSRYHLYISHSFEHAGLHTRILEFLTAEGVSAADYSVPIWDPIPGDRATVHAGIEERIRMSTHVVVVLTPGIHERYYVGFEIETAKRYGKKIIGIYPQGHNEGPIPQALDGYLHRAIGWRRQSLRKALDGEYPVETRTFDIAEVKDRVELVQTVGAAVGVISVIVTSFTAWHFQTLRAQLRKEGIEVVLDHSEWLKHAAPGAVIGGLACAFLVGLAGGNNRDMLIAGGIGLVTGAAICTRRYFKLKIQEIGHELRRLQFQPMTGEA